MRRALTMIELVFVIVVIGILSAVFIPRMERDSVVEAAIQVASHVRYAQHLAMVDDKYVPNPNMSTQANAASRLLEAREWYKGRWHIFFSPTANGTISYSIMSDSTISSYDGNPDANLNNYSEVARNPLDPNKYLIGTTYSSFDSDSDDHITPELDLGNKFGIRDISIQGGGGTTTTATRIIFDHLGRPYRGAINSLNGPLHRLAQTAITVKLCDQACTDPKNSVNNSHEAMVTVLPETGYVFTTFF